MPKPLFKLARFIERILILKKKKKKLPQNCKNGKRNYKKFSNTYIPDTREKKKDSWLNIKFAKLGISRAEFKGSILPKTRVDHLCLATLLFLLVLKRKNLGVDLKIKAILKPLRYS